MLCRTERDRASDVQIARASTGPPRPSRRRGGHGSRTGASSGGRRCIARFVTDRLRYRWRSGTGGGHWRARRRGVRGACAAHARHRRGQDPSCWTLDRICHSSESCSTPLEADGRDGVQCGRRQLNRSAQQQQQQHRWPPLIDIAGCIVSRHPGRGAGEVAMRSP